MACSSRMHALYCLQNPERGDPRGVGLDNKADYSPKKQDKFQGYAWIGAVDPTLLDHQNCELLFIGETTDLQGGMSRNCMQQPVCCPFSENCAMDEALQSKLQSESVVRSFAALSTSVVGVSASVLLFMPHAPLSQVVHQRGTCTRPVCRG